MPKQTHETLMKMALARPGVKNEYDALAEEFSILNEALKARNQAREDNEQLKKETLARWQEAENGMVISNEAVMEWLSTWGTDNEISRPSCKKPLK